MSKRAAAAAAISKLEASQQPVVIDDSDEEGAESDDGEEEADSESSEPDEPTPLSEYERQRQANMQANEVRSSLRRIDISPFFTVPPRMRAYSGSIGQPRPFSRRSGPIRTCWEGFGWSCCEPRWRSQRRFTAICKRHVCRSDPSRRSTSRSARPQAASRDDVARGLVLLRRRGSVVQQLDVGDHHSGDAGGADDVE